MEDIPGVGKTTLALALARAGGLEFSGTQSAFLEALQEGSVTADGNTRPFFLMATQNPQNFVGTFPLPEAELDRFGLSFSICYRTPSAEAEILRRWTVSSPGGSVFTAGRSVRSGGRRAGFCYPRGRGIRGPAVLSHRLVLSPQARFGGRNSMPVVRDIRSSIKKPTGL